MAPPDMADAARTAIATVTILLSGMRGLVTDLVVGERFGRRKVRCCLDPAAGKVKITAF